MNSHKYTVEHLLEYDTKYTFMRIHQTLLDGRKQVPFVYVANGLSRGTKSAIDIAKEKNFEICINAGLFNPKFNTYEPEGVIIENSKVVQNRAAKFYPDSKPLTIDLNGLLGYVEPDIDANDLVSNGIVSAVCGFMPIIIDHKPISKSKWTKVPHYAGFHQRQIIGQFENGDYAIITAEGRGYADSTGWTISQAQDICIKHGLKFAYNLDGGTSTETVVGGKLLNSAYQRHELRFAPTFIVFN